MFPEKKKKKKNIVSVSLSQNDTTGVTRVRGPEYVRRAESGVSHDVMSSHDRNVPARWYGPVSRKFLVQKGHTSIFYRMNYTTRTYTSINLDTCVVVTSDREDQTLEWENLTLRQSVRLTFTAQ